MKIVDLHKFDAKEYDLRYSKARELMEKKGLDGLLVANLYNCDYFSGASSTSRTFDRPLVFILPRDGEPVLLMNVFMGDLGRKVSWIKDIRTYEHVPIPFVISQPLEPIKEAIKDLHLTSGKIGAELNFPYFGSYLPVMLQKEFPRAKFVDASDILLRLRIVKTKKEIECVRKSCEITYTSYRKLYKVIREGMSERQIARMLIDIYADEGADFPGSGTIPASFLLMTSGGLSRPWSPTDKTIKKGDVVWIDSGTSYKGYWSDFSRVGTVGTPTERQKKMWEKMKVITEKCVKAVVPGIKVSDIHKASIHACKDAGLDPTKVEGVLSPNRANIGHAIGLFNVEPPRIQLDNKSLVEPGMTLTVEPSIAGLDGELFHMEENFVVTEVGTETLSRTLEQNRDLWRIE